MAKANELACQRVDADRIVPIQAIALDEQVRQLADSLFLKRTEVKSSVDRYANLEINYLLQRLVGPTGLEPPVPPMATCAYNGWLKYEHLAHLAGRKLPSIPSRLVLM
jgi:hypothetical protein